MSGREEALMATGAVPTRVKKSKKPPKNQKRLWLARECKNPECRLTCQHELIKLIEVNETRVVHILRCAGCLRKTREIYQRVPPIL